MKDNLQIAIYIGVPAAGKSTAAKQVVKYNSSWVRVCRDDFRFMLKDLPMCEPKIEELVTDLVTASVRKSLARKLNVIIDATNLKVKYIKQFVEEFKYEADIDYRVFDISLAKAIERDNAREKKVGREVIEKMYKDYKILLDIFDFQPVKKQVRPHLVPDFNSPLQHAIVVDIDGTLALINNRGPYDWEKVDRDDVNQIVAEQLEQHRQLGRKIILLSGRDEISRELTQEWLNVYEIPYDYLFMRKKDDGRRDSVVKRELYHEYIKDRFNIVCVYDDRLQVVDMWNKEGLFVFCVNQGLIEF